MVNEKGLPGDIADKIWSYVQLRGSFLLILFADSIELF